MSWFPAANRKPNLALGPKNGVHFTSCVRRFAIVFSFELNTIILPSTSPTGRHTVGKGAPDTRRDQYAGGEIEVFTPSSGNSRPTFRRFIGVHNKKPKAPSNDLSSRTRGFWLPSKGSVTKFSSPRLTNQGHAVERRHRFHAAPIEFRDVFSVPLVAET